eukprot:CAMPEP_0201511408 /NCGR_PEP_ID=MMETSP0161_2-20130828/3881_1 /ASSEMBLY_ACC=CAM_ASM_000251 /TAXON_ID=180227 /ORGANISM="Neoparamoeba aestuarina, Strain SoJaBio B1-5/56/2" /LENGTH=121 /DNA_ID=CAMNT_0047906897 /DNA_START=25 /DNA_END=390 /DNA_ORIENTATION=+
MGAYCSCCRSSGFYLIDTQIPPEEDVIEQVSYDYDVDPESIKIIDSLLEVDLGSGTYRLTVEGNEIVYHLSPQEGLYPDPASPSPAQLREEGKLTDGMRDDVELAMQSEAEDMSLGLMLSG